MKLFAKGFSFAEINEYIGSHPVIFNGTAALVLNTIIEMLSRRSIFGGLEAFAVHPLMFLYNALIIAVTLSVSVLVRRKLFAATLVSLFWLACGITNCVLLSFRTTPFSAVDLQILSSVMGVINVYLNGFEMFLILAAVLAAVICLAILYVKTPRTKGQINYIKACSVLAASVFSVFAIDSFSIAAENNSQNFPNIADAYEDYGFVYCFSNSIIDTGIERPEDYSAETMSAAAAEIGNDRGKGSPAEKPNIIFVQLESFFDVNYLNNISFSENPVPNFSSLKEKKASGFLTVPSIGAGTANTEFEVLTGISLDYFGASEYPYKSVLKETPCESICYNLADYGYSAHAIHNNDGTFYDRHKVYPNLGFDSFTSVEYMENAEYNPLGWADDSVITGAVTDALKSTENQDFVFAVSVQPHGKYPESMPENAPDKIKVTSDDEEFTEEQLAAFTYYVNQLYDTDMFIGELIGELEKTGEPFVLVLYGDHLPNLGIEESELENANLLQTEYVIYSSRGEIAEDKDISAYQLSARVSEQLGFGGGYVSFYNKNHADEADYPDKMQVIGYDMLFGEQYAFGGFKAAEMRMGVRDITADSYEVRLEENERTLYLYGKNFTEYSIVAINGDKLETEFVSSGILAARDIPELEAGDEIAAVQAGDDGEILSFSNAIIIE